MKRYFLDLSKLTEKDIEGIKAIAYAYNLEFSDALYIYTQDNPGRIKVLGEMDNGIITRDEITMDGVKEYKGLEALTKIFEEVNKNKNEGEK